VLIQALGEGGRSAQAACPADFAGSLVAARTLRSNPMSRAMIASVRSIRANAPRPLSPAANPVNRLSIAFLQNVDSLSAGSQPAAHPCNKQGACQDRAGPGAQFGAEIPG
jgi:hypothetical protein